MQGLIDNLKDAARYLLQNGQTKQGLAVQACVTMLEGDGETAMQPFTEDQIDQIYLSKVAGRGPFNGIREAFHAMVRTIEQAHGIGTPGVAGGHGETFPHQAPMMEDTSSGKTVGEG